MRDFWAPLALMAGFGGVYLYLYLYSFECMLCVIKLLNDEERSFNNKT